MNLKEISNHGECPKTDGQLTKPPVPFMKYYFYFHL